MCGDAHSSVRGGGFKGGGNRLVDGWLVRLPPCSPVDLHLGCEIRSDTVHPVALGGGYHAGQFAVVDLRDGHPRRNDVGVMGDLDGDEAGFGGRDAHFLVWLELRCVVQLRRT